MPPFDRQREPLPLECFGHLAEAVSLGRQFPNTLRKGEGEGDFLRHGNRAAQTRRACR